MPGVKPAFPKPGGSVRVLCPSFVCTQLKGREQSVTEINFFQPIVSKNESFLFRFYIKKKRVLLSSYATVLTTYRKQMSSYDFFFITNTSCSDLCLKVWISLISFHIVLMSARQRQKQESGDFPCFLVWSEHVGASDSKLNINRNNTAGNSSSCACVSLIQSAGWKPERHGF